MEVVFRVAEDPHAPEIADVVAGLVRFNAANAPPQEHRPLAVFASGGDGRLVGGASGYTHWGWLFVRTLWVHEDHRGAGVGRSLLELIESEAARRGCHSSHLDTYDFQAVGFYEKLGYRTFGELDNYPPGHRRYFLARPLGGNVDDR